MFWQRDRSVVNNHILIELKREIASLRVDVEQLQQRFRKKIKKSATEEEDVSPSFNDGFDELRKLNKEQNP